MAADYVGQRRAASGDGDANGVEDAALGFVQRRTRDVVEREAVRELAAMADGGGRVAHAGSVFAGCRLNGTHGVGFGDQSPLLGQIEKRLLGDAALGEDGRSRGEEAKRIEQAGADDCFRSG